MTLLDWVDPRLQAGLRAEFERRRGDRAEGLPRGVTVVLAGHRAAGKTTLLGPVAARLGRAAVDLDEALERRHGRLLREWLVADEPGFRAAERALFLELPAGLVVAVGGGFLSHHASALRGTVTVEVPVTFETYVERLGADTTRPRLKPGVPLDQELAEVFEERERLHRRARPLAFVDFCLRVERGFRPRRVVTLPPGASLERFAWQARHEGADLLEVRTDLHPKELDLLAPSRALPLLVAERGARVPFAWRRLASVVDHDEGEARALAPAATLTVGSRAEGLPDVARDPAATSALGVGHAGTGGGADAAQDPEARPADGRRALVAGVNDSPAPEAAGAPTPASSHAPHRLSSGGEVATPAAPARDAGLGLGAGEGLAASVAGLRSMHAAAPLRTDEALGFWRELPPGVALKHVEPLGAPEDFPRLLATQAALLERFGPERVTVLCTGPLAAPFRAVLAERNALDYLALDASWQAAPGQRLLADARRAARGHGRRLGILGSGIAHSRSPRIHPPPFERVDLPPDAPIEALLAALHPHYRGFAITNPFKKPAARAVKSPLEAINTLVRTPDGWHGANTDVAGAEATLEALRASEVTVLGDGGVGVALRDAAARRGVALTFVARAQVAATPVRGAVVWTWPASVEAPAALRFEGARVAVITYGRPGQGIARAIAARGGEPLRLGARWFIAQARLQRTLWESAS